jgi:hypothetical protein
MRRPLVVAAVATALGCATPTAFAASPVDHLSMSFDEPVSVMHVAGLGRDCPAFTGNLVENRHLDISGWIRDDGAAHALTAVTATVELVPDEASAVSYSGGYTAHQTGSFTAGGDDDRVVTTVTHGAISGTDGSSYKINEVAHFALDGAGDVRAWFDKLNCE